MLKQGKDMRTENFKRTIEEHIIICHEHRYKKSISKFEKGESSYI